MQNKKIINWIMGLGLVGLLVAIYQTYEHYFLSTAICDLSTQLACSPVTESKYGELPYFSGVAIALWGMLWWMGLIWLSRLVKKGKELIRGQDFWLFLYSLSGLGFMGYLLLVELYILPQETGELIICPFCTVQHILILIIAVLSYKLLKGTLAGNFKFAFFLGDKVDPKPLFIIGTLLIIMTGGYFILTPGETPDYPEFAACLAAEGATMYGFDACPHCYAQKAILGQEAFETELDDAGFYVRCRPGSEAVKPLGERVHMISSVEEMPESTTQSEACSINVGQGTPTWVIYGEKYVGEQSVEELSEITGCPLPESLTENNQL